MTAEYVLKKIVDAGIVLVQPENENVIKEDAYEAFKKLYGWAEEQLVESKFGF